MNKKLLALAVLSTLAYSSAYAEGQAMAEPPGILPSLTTANELNAVGTGLGGLPANNITGMLPIDTTVGNTGDPTGTLPTNNPSITTIQGNVVRIIGASATPNQAIRIDPNTNLPVVTGNVEITGATTTINGGSTSMQFDDNGATLRNNITGAPTQLHGIANGTSANDAVNFSQLNTLEQKVDKNATRAFSGIAQIAAMQAIPAPIAGKNYSIGMGGGFYAGQQAMAFGGKANVGEHVNVSASVANGFGSNKDMAASVGAGFSW